MNEVELRKFCMEKAIEIYEWRKHILIQNYNPIELANIIYQYIRFGVVNDEPLPGYRRETNK